MKLNKSQRMQMKAFICVLGLLLIFVLLIGKILIPLLHKEEVPSDKPGEETEVHVPVITVFTNVWIMDADAEKILVFRDGEEETYYYAESAVTSGDARAVTNEAGVNPVTELSWNLVREQVADITLTDGKVTDIAVKSEKLNAKVLRADVEGVELEGYGKLPLAADYKGYRVYNTLEMCTTADLLFGYDFADFVMEDGEICSILLAKEEAMEYIRVLIKASDYSALLHDEVVVTSDSDFTIQYGTFDNWLSESHAAGEEIVIGYDSNYFVGERVNIVPDVITGKVLLKSVNRSQGAPGYRGHMELVKSVDGIAVINEVSLEEYLYSVVPSEMPASYPDQALAAQAVCARTYAYGHMLHAGYPGFGAHVDDSTSYQVYNNILEQESTTTAVKNTHGKLLYTADGELAGTYYYSTSCGVGSDANVWKTEAAKQITYLRAKALNQSAMQVQIQDGEAGNSEVDIGELMRDESVFKAFITSVNKDDFEADEGWYRWTYQVEELDLERMLEIIRKRYNVNEKLVLTLVNGEYISVPVEELDEIRKIKVEKRGAGGVADELIIETGKHTYKIISEHNIRYVLNSGEDKIIRQDGSKIASPSILPSGFFIVETMEKKGAVTGYTLTGGGFGHGVGMSQNAARSMAKHGYHAEQILMFFYENCFIREI